MKRQLQFISMLFLAILGGASSASAQQANSVTQPTGDTWVRSDNKTDNYGTTNNVEMQNNEAGGKYFYGVMQFEFAAPQFGYKVASAQLRFTTRYKKGDSKLNFYALDAEVSDASTYASLESAITAAKATSPLTSCNVNGQGNKAPWDSGITEGYRVVSAWQNTIDLTDYVKSLSGNTFALLIAKEYNENNSTTIYSKETPDETNKNEPQFTFAAADLVPQLTVTYEPIYARVDQGGVIADFTTLNEAVNSITSEGTVTLYNDLTITGRCNTSGKTVTVVPAKAGITVSSTLNNSILFLSQGNVTVGCDDYQLTFDGGGVVNSSNPFELSGGTSLFNNVKFANCETTNGLGGIVNAKSGGNHTLKNVVFENCITPTGTGIIFVGLNSVAIAGQIEFNNCNESNIYLQNKYLKIGDLDGTQPKVITLNYKTPTLGAVILSSSTGGDKSALFEMINDNYGVAKKTGHYTDHVITEAYTQTMTEAGAATLILPFEARIPANMAAYTLAYTGGNTVTATPVSGTSLAANTPVLLNAEAGKYWFTNVKDLTEAGNLATVGTGTHTTGALTGVYSTTVVPANSYILANKEGNVGFYQVDGTTNTVDANRAYLTATGAGSRLSIVFNEETTGISSAVATVADDAIYNMQGVRVSSLKKGIYVKNGKKFIVK